MWALIFIAGLTVGLASSMILLGSSPNTTSGGPSVAGDEAGASEIDKYLAYRQTLGNYAAAVERGDVASMARFQQDLARQTTPAMVAAAHEEHAQMLANIAAAEGRGDAHMIAALQSQLAALCPTVDAQYSPSFCR